MNAAFAGNKGAEAMLIVLLDNLKNNFSPLNIYCEKEFRPVEIDLLIEKQITVFRSDNFSINTFIFNPRNIFKNIFRGYSTGTVFFKPDLVIDIGGLSFTDSSWRGTLRTFLKYLPFIFRRKPIIFFTQDFGPMNKTFTKLIARIVLGSAKYLFTRSPESFKTINSLLADKKILGPYPDSTLILSPLNFGKELNIRTPYIVISPSIVMRKKHGEEYINILVEIASELGLKYKIVILNHAFGKSTYGGDESICEELYSKLNDALLINENIDARELKNIISNASFAISSRYHVIVAALSTNVPAIALGWNPKYKNFLGLYERANYNLEFNPATKESALQLILNTPHEKEVKHLQNKNALLKERVRESFLLLNKKINELIL